ncbi:MAG: glycosyltransferase family 2 protein [Oligoflexia bacterium]|nr:glycosyltransferase family 2 protein [Oligoflexia bacterium]
MKVLVASFAYNEGVKIVETIKRFPSVNERDYDLMVCDDGSTDGSIELLEKCNVKFLRHSFNQGIGRMMKDFFDYAISNCYDVVVILAGNNKDDPLEIPRLLSPIINDGYDFIQGSRYLKGGNFGNMPLYRQVATRFIHPLMMSCISKRKITDSTNGFRAIRVSLLKNEQINYRQDWLDKYELEPYLFYKAIKLGYKIKEVPVTKIYPSKKLGYTKMRPITGWWSIMRPLILLGLGIKK